VSSITFSIFGSAAESFVFSYLGLCVFTYSSDVLTDPKDPTSEPRYPWGFVLIILMFAIVLFSRVIAIFLSHFLFRLCNRKRKPDVTLKELLFISWGGMIRGAIAFGLVLKIDDSIDIHGNFVFKERGAIVTTTLALVIITTVIFGSFMPVV